MPEGGPRHRRAAGVGAAKPGPSPPRRLYRPANTARFVGATISTLPHPLAPYGWDDRVATLFAALDLPHAVPGRVSRVDRGFCIVATADGAVRASPYTQESRQAALADVPATGDWVAVVPVPGQGLAVVWMASRWSTISRKDPAEGITAQQVLAANVDVLAVVCSLDRPLVSNAIERMLAQAWESRALPIVLLTKADLSADPQGAVRQAEEVSGRVAVHATSAVSGEGLAAISGLVHPARTLALLGPSGAGKSSLVNALVGRDVQSTGRVRQGDRRGRHTTTSRDLIPLPSGGVLLDTPGLRSLPLWEAETGVATTFEDIEEQAAGCRFRDCRHDAEPSCAVRAAVASGLVDGRRLASYRKLHRELADLELAQLEQARSPGGRRPGRVAKSAPKRELGGPRP